MSYRIVQRAEYGLPSTVTNSNGSPRPPLTNALYITAHYTGVTASYAGKDVGAEIRKIQNIFASTKPFEYNYVIGMTDDDKIYEYAGNFQAAHSAGENSTAFGVLFLVGVNDVVTPKMIDKWKWLRDALIWSGKLRPNPAQRMHYQMPGAATACPGNSIKAQWNQFLDPWNAPAPTPDPTPTPPPTPGLPQRIVMAERLEFTTHARWDSRPYGVLPAGSWGVILPGSVGKAAVKANLTIIGGAGPGYATAWQDAHAGTDRPEASSVNFTAGQVICNQIDVPLRTDGGFTVYLSAPASIIVDLVGYWT